jgi:MFS family permease
MFVHFGMLTAFLGLFTFNPIAAPLMRELGLSEIEAGLVVSVAALMWALTSPFWGKRSDRLGRKPVFLTGLFGFSLGFGLFALVAWAGLQGYLAGLALLLGLILTRMVAGALFSAAPVASQAYLADLTEGPARTAALATLGAAQGIGFVLGPALGGLLAGWGLLTPLVVGAMLPALAGLILLGRMPSPAPRLDPESPSKLRLFDPRIRPYLVVGFGVQMCIVVLQITAGFFLQDKFSLDSIATAQWLALALVLAGLGLIGAQLGIVRTLKLPPLDLMRWGLVAKVTGFVLILLGPSLLVLLLGFLVAGIGAGMILPAYQSAASLAVMAHEQGAVAGLTALVGGLASIVAPVLGTGLYQITQTLPFQVAIAVLLLNLLFVWLLPRPNPAAARG